MTPALCRHVMFGFVVLAVAPAAHAQTNDKVADELKALSQKIDARKSTDWVAPVVTLVIAVGGWAFAFYTLRRNEQRDSERRAEDRKLAEERSQKESSRNEERLRIQQAAADGARIESYLVSSLGYFSHGSRNRSIGLALIEAHWDDDGFARLRKVWTPILVGQALYLLTGPEAEAGKDPHEVENLRRVVALLRKGDLTSDDRQALKVCADAFRNRRSITSRFHAWAGKAR